MMTLIFVEEPKRSSIALNGVALKNNTLYFAHVTADKKRS